MVLFSRSFIRKRVISLATTVSVTATSFALAQDPVRAYHVRGARPIQSTADRPDYSAERPFLSENDAAMNKMMADMTIKPSGDVDRDFVTMMVPHHQGAIDMAKAELKYGHNELLRRMTEIRERPEDEDDVKDRPVPETDRVVALPNAPRKRRRRYGGALLGAGALLFLIGGLGAGTWRQYQADVAVAATAQRSRGLVPNVRVAEVRASNSKITVTLPATTTAFEAANIFARTSGYIEKRYVDIGDRVKAGTVLADIIAPELDHQITQAKATLAQNQATLQQTQASRELAEVTNARDSNLVKQGWLTRQQGDNDRLTLQAQQAAVGVAQSNVAAQEAQIRVLEQEKAYQRVVAPFDGVITQRAIDNGSLVQSGSTFMNESVSLSLKFRW